MVSTVAVIVSVPRNDRRLDLAGAFQHGLQHLLQPRERRFARDVVGAADLFFFDDIS